MTTPTQPNHPQSQPAGKSKLRLMIMIAIAGTLLIAVIAVGAFVFFRMRGGEPATPAAEVSEAAPAQVETIPLAGVPFPIYPGATRPEPALAATMGVPPEGVGLIASNASVAAVVEWYQTHLPDLGYTVIGVNAGVINALSPASQQITVNTWDMTGGGQIGVIANPVAAPVEPVAEVSAQPMNETTPPEPPPAEAPAPTEAQAAAQPLPEALPAEGEVIVPDAPLPPADPAQPVSESAPVPEAVAPTGAALPLEVSVTVSPTSIYAGTFNRLDYTLIVTGSGPVNVTATLPDGVLVHPDDFSAPGLNAYDPETHTWSWQPELAAGGVATAQFEAVNDLLHPPDSLVLKVVAQADDPAQQPLIQAMTLESEKY
jgi:hypothetical protein